MESDWSMDVISSKTMKLSAGENISIDAGGIIYIGASGDGNDVHIGSYGYNNAIKLYGNVTVNGNPINGGGGSAVATFG